MLLGTVYRIIFPNNKSYIGKTLNFSKRVREHKDLYKREKYPEYNCKLYKAIRKYGWDNLNIVSLEDNIPEELLNIKECEYIQGFNSFKNGYNSTTGGEGNILSEDHKRKISEAQIGEKNHNYGKKASLETRKKMSESHSKRQRMPTSEETKLKISLSKKGKTYEDIYGKEKAAQMKLNMSIRMMGNKRRNGK